MRREIAEMEREGRDARSPVHIPSASSYFTAKPGEHRKEMKKYNSHLLQLTGT